MATENHSKSDRERRHQQISTQIASEGIVLLENNDVLPFNNSIHTIALFGNGARRTIKGGTGSGDVNVRSFVSVEQGLLNAGYTIVSAAWLDEYDEVISTAKEGYYNQVREASKQGPLVGLLTMMGNPFQEPGFRCLSGHELSQYAADAAIYVLGRNSGEGADRKLVEGDYYLTEQEKHDIAFLSEHYEKFILLLNTGSVVDLAPVKDLPGLGAIVLISQGGSGSGDAVAMVLTGKVNPSGKLTATWAKSYEDYPFGDEFAGHDGNLSDSYYKEGIFVGYRYFDTYRKEPAWPFGFGRSYTDFSISTQNITVEETTINLQIDVINTGNEFSGREVVQVYITATNGKLDKPDQILVTFGKSKLLAPGESQMIDLSFPLDRLASYDECIAAWKLEQGEYIVRCGSSSRETDVVGVVVVPETLITEQCKNLFRGEHVEQLPPPQKNTVSTPPDIPRLLVDVSKFTMKTYHYPERTDSYSTFSKLNYDDLTTGKTSPEEFAATLTTEELALLCVGAARINLADFSIIGNFSDELPGAAGETTSLLRKHGVPSVTMVDGPAGIRVNPKIYDKDGLYIKNPEEDPIFGLILPPEKAKVDLSGTVAKYQYCTALPVATMLAQTWDLDLLEKAGKLIGAEMEEIGVDLWLAPGLNIQRNPLCGRNFEYFSEDPLISGLCASAIINGVQSIPGKGTTIKHLAANNQETNRNYNNSHVSERALRELYLKGFEICINESHPVAAMTSVNLVNGIHTANDYDLLTAVLRDEWGFDGVVMTDWGATSNLGGNNEQKYDSSSTVLCIKAGNDLIMPGSQSDVDRIGAAVKDGSLALAELQNCAGNILRLLKRITD